LYKILSVDIFDVIFVGFMIVNQNVNFIMIEYVILICVRNVVKNYSNILLNFINLIINNLEKNIQSQLINQKYKQ
jgi:hypothetical protein